MTPAPRATSRRARAGGARRQHHHRSHLAGRIDQGRQPGGQVPDRARRRAEGLQLVRRAARQPRGDDARHVRQRPAAQPAGARHRRRRDAYLPGGEVMTIYDAAMKYQRRGRAAGGDRGQGVRIGIVARLGGEGDDAARRQGGDRRELRAHPSQQPRQHGRAAAAVQDRRERDDDRPDRPRGVLARRRRRGAEAARRRHGGRARGRRQHQRPSPRSRASTRRRSWSRSRTAASCRTCCGSW